MIKIISGGQNGIDRMGLEVAKELGIETGGTAPKGYRTGDGFDLSLKDFGLVESKSGYYFERTENNVVFSDGTVLFGDMTSKGSALTIRLLKQKNRPYIVNPTIDSLAHFIRSNKIKTLNVAGNRASLVVNTIGTFRYILKEALIQVMEYQPV